MFSFHIIDSFIASKGTKMVLPVSWVLLGIHHRNMTTTQLSQNEELIYNLSKILFTCTFMLLSILWIVHLRHKKSRLYKYGNLLPGPPPLPLLGNILLGIGKKPDQLVKLGLKYRDMYGNVGRGWLLNRLVVAIAEPQDVEVILNNRVHLKKALEYKLFRPWLGDGLLISEGEKWRSHRKMIAPTFHINILKTFMDAFNENSKKVVEKMKTENGLVFDVHDYMSETTVDTLIETVMGVKKTCDDESSFKYADAVLKMCDILHQRHYKFWVRPEFLFKLTSLSKLQGKLLNTIHGLTNKIIKQKKESYVVNKNKTDFEQNQELAEEITKKDELLDVKSFFDNVSKEYKDDLDYNDENDVGEKKRLNFLDSLVDSAHNKVNGITDRDIRDEVNTLMFEGHDTVAAGSSFTLCLLGVHQNIQDKVYKELCDIFGDSDRPATFADTINMKNLERVILETLRLYPPVPIFARELTEDARIVTNNYLIPAGATVVIIPYGVHRNPKYYEDPDTFNPDNFLPENTQKRHYYSFIPFSAGPRGCVGRKYALLKLKVLLSTILRNFKVTSDVTEEDFVLKADIILKRADGFRIRLEQRK